MIHLHNASIIILRVSDCNKMTDYKALYEAKNREYEELLEQYSEL